MNFLYETIKLKVVYNIHNLCAWNVKKERKRERERKKFDKS
jgi:hypothetical protein